MRTTHAQTILQLARTRSYFGLEDVAAAGTPRVELTRLVRNGLLHRVSRGLYRHPQSPRTEHDDLIQAAHRYGQAVFCLHSALRLHGLVSRPTDQLWLAVPREKNRLRTSRPSVHVIRVPGKLFDLGIENHNIGGFQIRTYGVARTVVDCFKYRQLIGPSVALEGLKRAWMKQLVTLEDLLHFAAASQVSDTLQPYLDSLVWQRPEGKR